MKTKEKIFTVDEPPARFQRSYIVFERSGVPGVTATIIGWTEAPTAAVAKTQAALDHGLLGKDILVQPKSMNSAAEWREALEKQAEVDYEKRQAE